MSLDTSERRKVHPSYFSTGKLPLVTSQPGQDVRTTSCQQVSAGSWKSDRRFQSTVEIQKLSA